ncbi:hypothetical protein GYN67_06075 [Lactococcus piscium]|uniref:rhamnan synthesis F family protein n=1 Tax=Pseudolactococcus carnosus TaxID=2749961 RepID=UPI001FBAA631|nr:rhamnan synthesis F family protein [Lactococcus carnosus]MCJ1996250.1 hypothetical protein [Lactococcus carnosus]
MSRLLFYVHFNRENKLSQHVIYQLKALRPIYSKIVLISNSKLEGQLLTQLPFDDFLQRENKGFDFAAWSEGMRMIGFEDMRKFDSVTIMNDTTFGPIFDFEPIVNRMEKSDNDFWGITNNRAHQAEIGGHMHDLKAHIQSYFITFKQSVVSHPSFSTFWKNIQNYTDVNQVILKYETAVTDYFIQAGFKYDVQFDTVNSDISDMQNSDFSIFGLSHLLSHQIPFIKVKAFSHNAEKVESKIIFNKITQVSDYPSHLIIDHMTFADYPDRNYMLSEKIIDFDCITKSSKKVGIHLHVHQEVELMSFLSSFEQYLPDYDLYITTSQLSIVEKMSQKAEFVTLVDPSMNGMLAWQKVHEQLSHYEVAGHFETIAHDETITTLLKPASKIISKLIGDGGIGLVIPDICYEKMIEDYQEDDTWPYMAQLWNIIYPNNEKNLKKQDVYVKSLSGNIWYKPKALEKLLSIDMVMGHGFDYDNVSLINRSFSNLLVYTAWANGFDFRLSQSQILTGVEVKRFVASKSNLKVEDTQTVGCPTVNHRVTFPSRILKYFLRKLIG